MSSVGIAEKPAHIEPENLVADRQSRVSRFGAEWLLEIWGTNTFSPADLFRMFGYRWARKQVINGILRRMRSDTFSEEEKEWFIEWFLQVLMRPKSSELCVSQLFAPMAFSEKPLCHELGKLEVPIAFMYGDYDWVSRDVGDRLVDEGKVSGEVFMTENSGHHLYVEAALECASCLIKFVHGEQAQNDFICAQ